VEIPQTTRLLEFAAVPIRLQRRSNDRIVPMLQFPDKIRKTGRKRDAVADAGVDVTAQLWLHQINTARIAFLKN
jgi:hypothetical protein